MRRLQAEIKQRKPFAAPEEEAFLNLVRTTDALMRGEADLLKEAGLSPPQYNVLRILRGAGGDGLRCGEIAERMVARDPDITRLLDRLERRGLVMRTRDSRDRRVVTTQVTARGLELLSTLDAPLTALHRAQLGHLGRPVLRQLIALLERARSQPAR